LFLLLLGLRQRQKTAASMLLGFSSHAVDFGSAAAIAACFAGTKVGPCSFVSFSNFFFASDPYGVLALNFCIYHTLRSGLIDAGSAVAAVNLLGFPVHEFDFYSAVAIAVLFTAATVCSCPLDFQSFLSTHIIYAMVNYVCQNAVQ
jgi:hypothetical protein